MKNQEQDSKVRNVKLITEEVSQFQNYWHCWRTWACVWSYQVQDESGGTLPSYAHKISDIQETKKWLNYHELYR